MSKKATAITTVLSPTMPLDLLPENGDRKHYNLPELRLEIIGNKDLKFKLLNDVAFMNHLVSNFAGSIDKLIHLRDETAYPLDILEEVVVTLRILSSFASEIDSLNNDGVSGSIGIMQQALDPITQLLNYFVEIAFPLQRGECAFQVEALMGHCLDILIVLSNLRQNQVTPTTIWRYITSLLMATDVTRENSIKLHPSIIIKLLRLIPLVLTASVPLNSNALMALATALLSRLSSDCKLIVQLHLSEVYQSQEDLFSVAFEDDHLPNVDLNNSLVESVASAELLMEMITASSQLMSFSKLHHDPFLLAVRRDAPFGIFLSTPLSKPLIPLAEIYISLLLLMKVNSKELNLASLNLLVLLLENLGVLEVLSETIIFRNYDKLFATIIQLLDYGNNYNGDEETKVVNRIKRKVLKEANSSFDRESLRNRPRFMASATEILANLCTQFPTLSNRICDTNIDYKLVCRMTHCFNRSGLFKAFEELKLRSKFGTVLVDFVSTPIKDFYSNELADLFLLLSVYTSEREEYRNRLVSLYQTTTSNIPKVIFEIVEGYHFLLNQIRLTQRVLSYTGKTRNVDYETQKRQLSWLGKNLGVISILADLPLFTNCFYFIRSQSRSVATLRTFFVEANYFKSFVTRDSTDNVPVVAINGINSSESNQPTIRPRINGDAPSNFPSEPSFPLTAGGFVTNILEIIRLYETLDLTWDFIFKANKNKFVQEGTFRKTFKTNKALCVSLLANFILDFSSFRYKIVGYENFLSSLSIIYQNSTSDFDEVSGLTEEDVFERNVMQLKILQVMKNFMYNEASENKQEVLNFFPLSLILQKANFGIPPSDRSTSEPKETRETKLQQKIVAFEILRNFTAGSPSFSRILREAYTDEYLRNERPEVRPFLPQNWSEFIIRNITEGSIFLSDGDQGLKFDNDEALVQFIGNENYVKMVRSINFTEDHTYTVVDKLKRALFPSDDLLRIWMRLLSFKLPETISSNPDLQRLNKNLNMIKISIAWILVNLTWKSSDFAYDLQNYTDYEVYQTVDTLGIKRVLSQLNKTNEDVNGESTNEQELTGDELSVYDRAKYLDQFGFTKVIYDVLTDYTRKASKIPQSNSETTSDVEPDVFEKLRSALHQINYLCRGVRSGSFVPDLRTNHAGRGDDLRLHRNQDNTVDVVDDIGDLVDDEIRYEISRRRDEINSEDDGNNEDEEMQEDESSESNPEAQVGQATGNESDESNDEMPHEYWVM